MQFNDSIRLVNKTIWVDGREVWDLKKPPNVYKDAFVYIILTEL